MSFPSIHDIVQSDLYTSEDELRQKLPDTAVDRLLRIRAMYNWLISNPETKDKEFVDETVGPRVSLINVKKSCIKHKKEFFGTPFYFVIRFDSALFEQFPDLFFRESSSVNFTYVVD